MTPEEHKNELLKRIRAAIGGVHDISEESNEELVPGVYWPSRWLTDSIRAAQTEQKRKDAEIARRYMGGCMEHTVEPFLDGQRAASKKIADIIQAQEETP